MSKYIAIFDIPDGYGMGCAVAKIAPKGKEIYEDKDFENKYAEIELLAEAKAETFERFKAVERIIQDLGLSCAYDMPSFWTSDRKDYKVIPTKYHKGYMQALTDVEREIRLKFGFAERTILNVPPFTMFFGKDGESVNEAEKGEEDG